MTPKEGHIGLLEGVMFLYAVLTAKVFLDAPGILIQTGGPAAWQVALIMTAASLLLFLPTAALARRFPGQGLAEISERAAGPVLGTLIVLAVVTWLICVVASTLRNFAETLIITILPDTPPSVLVSLLALCILFASYRGVEPLVRTNLILFVLIAAGLFVVLAFSLPRADAALVYPFWGHGIEHTVTGGIWWAGLSAEAVALLVLGYAFRDPHALKRSGVLGILLFGLTATVSVAVLVMIFGSPEAAQLPMPFYTLARLVYLGRFLQRTEAVIVMFWCFAAIIRMTGLFHAATVATAGVLKLNYYRPLVFPMAVVVVSVALLPQDYLQVLRFDRDWLRPAGLVTFLVPLLLLILAMVRRKGGPAHAA